MTAVRFHYQGGPTALLELAGMRLLTDPTFEPPDDHPIGERLLSKTQVPALTPDALRRVDAILLPHDQHPDNLGRLGRELLFTMPTVPSTEAAAKRLGRPVHGLANWHRVQLQRADGIALEVIGVAALHGPESTDNGGPLQSASRLRKTPSLPLPARGILHAGVAR